MTTNNFKPFATAANANVMSQTDWEALPALLSGFISGPAKSAQVNKAIRQASFIAAALAQYTANKSGLDVLDDGDLNGFISKMGTAFGKDFQALDATLTALAGLATGANKLPYFTGNDTAAQTDLTSVGRDIIGKNTIADILTYLGLRASGQYTDNLLFTGPDGLKIQVFRRTLANQTTVGVVNTVPVTFPVPFPVNCWGVFSTKLTWVQIANSCEWVSNTGFTAQVMMNIAVNTNTSEAMFLAIGY